MASRLFAHGIYEQPKSMVILKWIILPLLVVHVVLASWSGYRAIVQVYSVDLTVAAPRQFLKIRTARGYRIPTLGVNAESGENTRKYKDLQAVTSRFRVPPEDVSGR